MQPALQGERELRLPSAVNKMFGDTHSSVLRSPANSWRVGCPSADGIWQLGQAQEGARAPLLPTWSRRLPPSALLLLTQPDHGARKPARDTSHTAFSREPPCRL